MVKIEIFISNRYYVAEGVRIYNQDTWRMITGQNGKELVEEFIEPVVKFPFVVVLLKGNIELTFFFIFLFQG